MPFKSLKGQRLRFWFNAFIPAHVPNFTQTIAKGKHAGKTVVPFPAVAFVPNLEKIKTTPGFLTDQRGFSSDPEASTRMRHIGSFDLGVFDTDIEAWENMPVKNGMMLNFHASKDDNFKWRTETSGTIEVDLGTGKEVARKNASLASMTFEQSPEGLYTSLMMDRLTARRYVAYGSASDPLVRMAACIDYSVVFIVTLRLASRTISVALEGEVDGFPAYEAYATAFGTTGTLLQLAPPAGNTVMNLLGDARFKITTATQASFSYFRFIK
jgi:hypothetical protein